MPTVLIIGPYRFAFWSQDCREMMHIHVFRDGKSAKFWLASGALATNNGFQRKELRQIALLITENRQFLQEKWDEHCRRT